MLNTLDAFLFTTYTNLGTSFISNLFPALFAAAIIALLWRPAAGQTAERRSLAAYVSTRRPGDWVWRFVAAWLCFPPIYYVAGRGAAFFTLPRCIGEDGADQAPTPTGELTKNLRSRGQCTKLQAPLGRRVDAARSAIR